MKMKVRVTDLEQDAVTVYDLSNVNWAGKWAAMGSCSLPDCRDRHVLMWIPKNTKPPFKMITSGRCWESFKEENENGNSD